MSSKVTYFIGTLIATAVILVGLAMFMSRAPQTATVDSSTDKSTSIDTVALKENSTKTKNLQNFGNLPAAVAASELGRDNPFNSY